MIAKPADHHEPLGRVERGHGLPPSVRPVEVAAGGIELYTASGLPVPGTFAEGSGASLPYLQLIITDTGCVAHSGAFTIVNVDAGLGDSAPGYIHSLLLDFDLVCGTQGVHGCLRYSQ